MAELVVRSRALRWWVTVAGGVAALASGPFVGAADARSAIVRPAHAVPFGHGDAHAVPALYVSDEGAGAVYGFDRQGNVIRTITSFGYPLGLFVDRRHVLWVVDNAEKKVFGFVRGAGQPAKTLTGLSDPIGVTACADGTIYVAGGTIEVFAHGSTTPTGSLTAPAGTAYLFVACDSDGNILATGGFSSSGDGFVDEFVGAKQSGYRSLGITLGFPGGIQTSGSGTFIVADPAGVPPSFIRTITEYDEDGPPTGRQIKAGPVNPMGIALSHNGKRLIAANFTTTTAAWWDWPSGGIPKTLRLPPGSSSNAFGAAWDPQFDP